MEANLVNSCSCGGEKAHKAGLVKVSKSRGKSCKSYSCGGEKAHKAGLVRFSKSRGKSGKSYSCGGEEAHKAGLPSLVRVPNIEQRESL